MLSGCGLVRNEGTGAVDNQITKKMEAIARGGGWGEAGPDGIEDGVGSCTSTRNLLSPPILGYQPSVSVSNAVTSLSSEHVLFEDTENECFCVDHLGLFGQVRRYAVL